MSMFCPMYFRSPRGGDDVKFEEFVQFVLAQAQHGPQTMDQHWQPQCHSCLPCSVKYDFVGHFETLTTDAEYVLRRIANGSDVPFPGSEVDGQNRNSWDFYTNVSSRSIERLLSLYRPDYEIFGYDIPAEIRRRLPTLNQSTAFQ